MRQFASEKIKALPPSGIREFFAIADEMKDVISLALGEPDYITPRFIIDEGVQSLREGHTNYSSCPGNLVLREEIAKFLKEKYGMTYDPDGEIVVTVGASEAIDVVFRAMLDPGDEVICPEPCFVSYKPCIYIAGGVPVSLPLSDKNHFKLQASDLEKYITPKTKAIFVSYPSNPTGAVMTKEDWEPIVEVIKKHDLFVVTDEIYAELHYGAPHTSIASLPGMRERCVLISGFSKAFAMTGWRLGYMAGPKSIMEYARTVHEFAVMSAPTTAQIASVIAMRQGAQATEEMRLGYDHRRKYILARLTKMNIPCFEPLGAFYIFPDISQFGLDDLEFCRRFLQEEHVAIVPGSAFGAGGSGHVRIAYVCDIPVLEEAMDRLERFISKLPRRDK